MRVSVTHTVCAVWFIMTVGCEHLPDGGFLSSMGSEKTSWRVIPVKPEPPIAVDMVKIETEFPVRDYTIIGRIESATPQQLTHKLKQYFAAEAAKMGGNMVVIWAPTFHSEGGKQANPSRVDVLKVSDTMKVNTVSDFMVRPHYEYTADNKKTEENL